MAPYILQVPKSGKYFDWVGFTKKSLLQVSQFETVCVDFGSIDFLDPEDFVTLACIIESFNQNGAKVSFKGGTQKFNSHLDNIKLKKYWTLGFDREKVTKSNNDSTFCLWKISQGMIDNYADEAKKYFNTTFFKEYDLYPLSLSLKEVFNNVFDHADSPVSGYVTIQFFPKTKFLSFSVCDLGVGIPVNVNRHLEGLHQNQMTDHKAIEKAFDPGFSSGTPKNKGLGLGNILNQAKDCNGKLQIISNNGVYQFDDEVRLGPIGNSFPGTLFKLELDSTKFDLIDNDEDEIQNFELF